jgi:hypothetical protein
MEPLQCLACLPLHGLQPVPCVPGAWALPKVTAVRLVPCCNAQRKGKQGCHTEGGANGCTVCCTQTDKKTLNTKVMMQEIKDIRETRRSAEATAKAVSVQTPFVFPLNPDLTFNCQDECGCSPSAPSSPAHNIRATVSTFIVSCCRFLHDPSETGPCHQMQEQVWLRMQPPHSSRLIAHVQWGWCLILCCACAALCTSTSLR